METLHARRIVSARRRASSRPIVAETDGGVRLVKLRGAGQGTSALIAEIIVAELAEALGLFVSPRSLVTLPESIETADWDDELADLLTASVGINLGFDFLDGAVDFASADASRVPATACAEIFWLDRFVMNPDRTAENPNLLWWSDHLWLIDHGASLGFQYSWETVSESGPSEPRLSRDAHLFESLIDADLVATTDERLAAVLARDVLTAAVAQVPESFLTTGANATAIARRRAAYVAYLWKRLRSPRTFLEIRDPLPVRVGPRQGKRAR